VPEVLQEVSGNHLTQSQTLAPLSIE